MAGHRFNPDKADRLLDPKRRELVAPEQVIKELKVNQENVIADLGAGNGFFTIPLARATIQRVYAVDIEEKMLNLLKENATSENIDNIQYILSDLENISLNNEVVDKVLVAFVVHEIPNLKKALSEFKRILKQNGTLLILEWEAIEMEMGPPLHERIPSERMKEILKENNLSPSIIHFSEAVYGAIINI
ncbi:class I SAM-dependent methyltransferase [Bacillus sp. AFS040349]|uniref:class I SAM-dependent methyltransferase n=1 Tax=Bacillus sp. AFS040349 TaxID=2033502 RepID=UPI000BFC1C55|nr:class I SAM-dependent methyltransferase [Bacillus sp. AFS040349]PGT80510.1 SAM-dependent methyltransferase [Bacillus sp. AFS040349]